METAVRRGGGVLRAGTCSTSPGQWCWSHFRATAAEPRSLRVWCAKRLPSLR